MKTYKYILSITNVMQQINEMGKLGFRVIAFNLEQEEGKSDSMYALLEGVTEEDSEVDDVVEESNAMLRRGHPNEDIDEAGQSEQLAKRAAWSHLEWDNCAIEFEQDFQKEGYRVTVKDNAGDVIKTWVALYEWSGYVTPFINEKDVPGLVRYLCELNRIDRREGTYIRSEEWL